MDFDLAYSRLIEPSKLRSPGPAHVVANEFEDSLLGIEHVPEEHLAFVCRVLSDRALLARAGLEYLVMALYSDQEKLSEFQLRRLFGCIEASYGWVRDETLAFALGDFIARVMPPKDALGMLQELTTKSTSRAAMNGVFVGLDILRRQAKTASPISTQAVEAATAIAEARNDEFE